MKILTFISNPIKTIIVPLFIFFGVGILLTHCYYDSAEELYINENCDETNVTYDSAVQPILQESCLGCHGSSYSSTGGGIDLRTYTATKTNIDGIIGSINHNNGYQPMPKNSAKLSDCKINIIQLWKSSNFPQN